METLTEGKRLRGGVVGKLSLLSQQEQSHIAADKTLSHLQAITFIHTPAQQLFLTHFYHTIILPLRRHTFMKLHREWEVWVHDCVFFVVCLFVLILLYNVSECVIIKVF